MTDYLLECCADSVESAVIAEQGGADRLELCSNLILGGTTPGIQLYHEVREHTKLPIRVLIRPRYGDFLYSPHEYKVIKREVTMFEEAQADGVVIGCLKSDGTFDMPKMQALKRLSGEMKITVHRAFDMVKDPIGALKQLMELGIDSILTSGQAKCCISGSTLLQMLIETSEQKVNIMAGSGVKADTIRQLLTATGVKHFHMSGKMVYDSGMIYRKQNISMGLPFFPEYQLEKASLSLIQDAKKALLEQTI